MDALSTVSLLPDRADAGPCGEEAAVPIDSLPENPDIEKLKDHAKILRDLVRGGFEEPVVLVREHHPRLAELTAGAPGAARPMTTRRAASPPRKRTRITRDFASRSMPATGTSNRWTRATRRPLSPSTP